MAWAISFPAQPHGAAGEEVVAVDGRELRLHDYAALFAVPGLYEAVVQDALGCRAPAVVAEELARAAGGAPLRVLDLGAGNGVSGEALRAAGLDPVLAIDLEPAARDAARRDRPQLYRGGYLTADATALSEQERAAVRAAGPQALAVIGALGGNHVPRAAVEALAALLEPPRLVAFAFDVELGDPLAGAGREISRRRYVHRRTAAGGERVWEAVVAAF